jgi:predicted enzyme related to lactoylglutathione lyase
MFKDTHVFSGFSVNDLTAAKSFYGETLGIDVAQDEMGLQINLAGGNTVFVYEKEGHEPASFTILNFVVDDINTAVDGLVAKGVVMERYDNMPFQQDERGIARGKSANMGPDIAWFKDPAGNILSVLEN